MNFESQIKVKTDEELIAIYASSKDYTPEYLEFLKKELENRNLLEKVEEKVILYLENDKKHKLEMLVKKKKKQSVLLIVCGIILLFNYIYDGPIIPYSKFLWGAFVFLGIFNLLEYNKLKKSK